MEAHRERRSGAGCRFVVELPRRYGRGFGKPCGTPSWRPMEGQRFACREVALSPGVFRNGTSWDSKTSGTIAQLNAVWAWSTDDAWAVGNDGTVLRWNGTTWNSVQSGISRSLTGIWGNDVDDVWSVGEFGSVFHWNGTTWEPMESGTSFGFFGVWSAIGDDIWVVGQMGAILRKKL